MERITYEVKQGSVTRRFKPSEFHGFRRSVKTPRAGDLVLARVARPGRSDRLEGRTGRPLDLYVGDHMIGVFGTCHDPFGYEGGVPGRLHRVDLLASPGILGQVQSRHRATDTPTELEVLGYVFDEAGARLRLDRHRLASRASRSVPTLLVVGDTPERAVTRAAAGVVRCMHDAGLAVAAGRVTGTAHRAELLALKDAGAAYALDFSAFGHPSTYLLEPDALRELFHSVQGHLAATGVDVVVLQLGNGLMQRETEILLESDDVCDRVDGALYDASGVLSANASFDVLVKRRQLDLLAVCGAVADSTLGIRAVEDRLGVACVEANGAGRSKLGNALAGALPALFEGRARGGTPEVLPEPETPAI